MDDLAVARALHVFAIVLWIGGVGLVTTVLLPALRRLPDPAQRIAVFEAAEGRFGAQARLSVLLAGLSGLYMLVRMAPGIGSPRCPTGGCTRWCWYG